MIKQQQTASSAIEGLCLINGVTKRGKKAQGRAIALSLPVKLKVLTRQACFADKGGERIDVDPTSEYFTPIGAQPKEGDTVRIKGNQLTHNERGELLSFQDREYMVDNEIPLYEFEDVKVDEDGCITVDCDQAMQLLRNNGATIRKPQYRKAHSSITDRKQRKTLRNTNWFFEEVNTDYSAGKKGGGKGDGGGKGGDGNGNGGGKDKA